jgi:hypothetical protein
MDQDVAINKLKTTSNSKTYNPREPISTEDLATIITSHDKLQAWNNATEAALEKDAEDKNTDARLIQNIRNTAALIISSERSTFSQNFELRHARNLSDSTISTLATTKAFAEGVLYEATSPIRELVNFQQPSSMNLNESNKRVDDLESMIMYYGTQALDLVKQAPTAISNAASFTWENPDLIAKNIANAANKTLETYSQSIDKIPSVITHGLKSSNPEQTIGFNCGVIAFGVIKETFSSAGHKVRDFSKHMTFYPNEEDFQGNKMRRVFYNPTEGHSINAYVDMNGQLHYHIIKSDGDNYGHGNEMFASMVEKFEQNDVEIRSIKDTWRVNGRDSTNGLQYLEAITSGLPPDEAAFLTFTGKQAKALGITNVVVPPTAPSSPFKPVFTKSGEDHSSIDSQTVADAVVSHLKTLGLPPEKEQIAIAHVELKRQVNISHDDSISA